MCGIAGGWDVSSRLSNLADVADAMGKALAHRGPDGGKFWLDASHNLALVHRRLAVVDLSASGLQPMQSACDRYMIVFNGEIYNHLDLRRKLSTSPGNISSLGSFNWRGHSDTETLLACVAAWGIDRALKACVGMFAFALWDRKENTLTLARDRFGEKPLYYSNLSGTLVFASELKAFKCIPHFRGEIDRLALAEQMRNGYVPESMCIYKGVHKLPPGHWITINAENITDCQFSKPIKFWSASDSVLQGVNQPLTFNSDAAAIRALDECLRQAVQLQMIADVPLGAFLSGGIDSSTVVALMQAQSSRPVKTFAIGFNESGYNEAHHAKAVAQHLGTEHTELYVSAQDAIDTIPKLSFLYDEPFSDASQIPTYLVSKMARQHVTVSLSGDGGDELFGGYSRYFLAARVWNKLAKIPLPLRRLLASTLQVPSPSHWNQASRLASPLLADRYKNQLIGDRIHKSARALTSKNGRELYNGMVDLWDPGEVVIGHVTSSKDYSQWLDLQSLSAQMMAYDSITYLPSDILTKVDRAAMSVSLETRVPMLDHRVFEFAWQLPMEYKIRSGVGKWLLRQVLNQYVPQKLVDRPKMGFGVPIDSWLRGPLKDWATDLLNPSRLRNEGYFQEEVIQKKWAEHQSGQRNWQYHLWAVLMFQSWQDKWNA
jgi:asparagine synthase (glutamine-hydrolysing)